MLFGALLTVLGIVLYSQSKAPTALIPCGFGLALVLLGQIAQGASDKVRMHTMHAAAVIGLVGLVVPAYRATAGLISGEGSALAIGGNLTMAALCAIFLGLVIKSF